jgi:hypothetical protein
MNYTIRQIIRRVITPPNQPAVMLGRWRLTYSEKALEKTIERANEDHCGTCVNPPKEEASVPAKRS